MNTNKETKENGNLPIFSVRHSALDWWNNLASATKTQICDTNTELVGNVRRWETLTGREIEMLYRHYA